MNTNKDSHFLSTVWFPSRKCTNPRWSILPVHDVCSMSRSCYFLSPPSANPRLHAWVFSATRCRNRRGGFFRAVQSRLWWRKKTGCFFLFIRHGMWRKIWLVVEPTHLKNMLVKLGSSSPSFGVKIKTYLKPPPRNHHTVDGRNPAPADTVNIPLSSIIYKVLYNPAGAGFLSSRVWHAGTSIFPRKWLISADSDGF